MATRPHLHKPNGYTLTLLLTSFLYFIIYFTYFNEFTLNFADIIYHRVPEDSRRPYHYHLQMQLEILSHPQHTHHAFIQVPEDNQRQHWPHGFIFIPTLIFTILYNFTISTLLLILTWISVLAENTTCRDATQRGTLSYAVNWGKFAEEEYQTHKQRSRIYSRTQFRLCPQTRDT